jgi:hypothetical protein
MSFDLILLLTFCLFDRRYVQEIFSNLSERERRHMEEYIGAHTNTNTHTLTHTNTH